MAKSQEEKEAEKLKKAAEKKAAEEAAAAAEEAAKNVQPGDVPGHLDHVEDDTTTPPTPPAPGPSGVPEGMVQVKKEDLENLLSRMDKQSKDIELLYSVADKSRLSRAMNENGEVLIKQARVSMWDDTGIFVTAWKLITNKCEVVMGRWVEEQTVNVVLENGKTMQVPLIEFYRKTVQKESGDIIGTSEKTDYTGKKVTILELEFKNGKKLEISNVFVN